MHDAWRMLWPLLLAGIASRVLGHYWPLVAALLLLLLWQIWQKWRLARWLARGNLLDPPFASGLWEDYYTRLMHLFRREQRAQQSLRDILDRARYCADSMDEGVLLLNAKGELEYANRMAGRLLALSGRDQGQALVNLLRYPEFRQYLETADFSSPLLLPYRINATTLQFHGSDLAGEGTLLRVEDVTHVQALQTLRRDFVANVSHELKTPLTVFRGYLEMMAEQLGEGDSPLRLPLDELQAQNDHMEALVRDLLLLSRLEATRPVDKTAVSLQQLGDNLLQAYQPLATAKQQTLSWQAAPSLVLNGIESELFSALGNLIGNAIKYTPTGGAVTVEAQQEGDMVCLTVADNGPGIDTWHLPNLTKRFYRVEKSRNSETGGTGLGLAIVKHILQRHNGRLEINSQLGEGSQFVCWLPAETPA